MREEIHDDVTNVFYKFVKKFDRKKDRQTEKSFWKLLFASKMPLVEYTNFPLFEGRSFILMKQPKYLIAISGHQTATALTTTTH